VAITGFGRSDDIERARTAGFYSHLTKPLNLDALAEVLAQLARHQRGRGIDGHDRTPDTDFDATAGPVC
jgi:DNA-binding NtrC family response regulator